MQVLGPAARSGGAAARRSGRAERSARRAGRFGRLLALGALGAGALALAGCTGEANAPSVRVQVGGGSGALGTGEVSLGIQLLVLLTVLSIAPGILMMVTSFIRIAIVLSFIRNAIGVPQLPPNQVLLGLSLFLTVFVMAPVWQAANEAGVQGYLRGELPAEVAFDRASQPVRQFMLRQTREADLALFVQLAKLPRPRTPDDVPTHVLVPAFMVSELKTAFQMGFMILVPFLIIDLVVSSMLMAMGMMMLPPATISLPFKVLLFVLADGWHLIVRSLVTSFN